MTEHFCPVFFFFFSQNVLLSIKNDVSYKNGMFAIGDAGEC